MLMIGGQIFVTQKAWLVLFYEFYVHPKTRENDLFLLSKKLTDLSLKSDFFFFCQGKVDSGDSGKQLVTEKGEGVQAKCLSEFSSKLGF
jgi:hypothetical protein